MTIIIQAVLTGMLVMLAGTIPRNLLFAANLRVFPGVPWAVPVTAAYLWFGWRYLKGTEPWRTGLRATPVPGRVWAWALPAGGLAIVALVFGLQVANRMMVLPVQQMPDLGKVPALTVVSLLIMAAPVAGVIEEAAFRGYMQGPIERRYGLGVAILVTGTMFAVAHLDFTPILWPYYVAVAAIYGTVTYLTESILPAVVLHTGGNLYSNIDLWRHGQAEWQATSGPAALIWTTGADRSFWISVIGLVIVAAAAGLAFAGLARLPRSERAIRK